MVGRRAMEGLGRLMAEPTDAPGPTGGGGPEADAGWLTEGAWTEPVAELHGVPVFCNSLWPTAGEADPKTPATSSDAACDQLVEPSDSFSEKI